MLIPEETINFWNSLKDDGDAELLKTELGVSKETIYRIFREKIGRAGQVKLINAFYEKRKIETAVKVAETDQN